MEGEPVTTGAVMAAHQTKPTVCPIAGLDEDGHFELSTDSIPGAPVGQYKLKVAAFGGMMGNTPLVPKEYTELSTTPLLVQVTGDPNKNFFEIELLGDLPPEPTRPEPVSNDGATEETPDATETKDIE